jgi:DNA-binding NarL/FixJ family response regulator
MSQAGLTAIGHARSLDGTVGGGSAARRRPLAAFPTPEPRPLRLVIADDNPIFPELLLRTFHHHEWIEVVGCAANGRDAVTIASATEPDLVLMDLNMPVLDGIEATRRIVARNPEVAVVVLTASATTSECSAVLAAGARMVLPKSIDLAALVDHLRDTFLRQTQTESSPPFHGARSNQP